MAWDVLFCFVLFCEKRFGQGRTGPLPEITHLLFGGALPLPLYYPCPRKFSRLLELVLPKKTKQPATGLYRQVPFLVFLMSFWKMLFLLWFDGMGWHGIAWDSMGWHGIAWDSMG